MFDNNLVFGLYCLCFLFVRSYNNFNNFEIDSMFGRINTWNKSIIEFKGNRNLNRFGRSQRWLSHVCANDREPLHASKRICPWKCAEPTPATCTPRTTCQTEMKNNEFSFWIENRLKHDQLVVISTGMCPCSSTFVKCIVRASSIAPICWSVIMIWLMVNQLYSLLATNGHSYLKKNLLINIKKPRYFSHFF